MSCTGGQNSDARNTRHPPWWPLRYPDIRPRSPVPGTDFAGEVVATGSEVAGFTVGERVWGFNDTGVASQAQYRSGSVSWGILIGFCSLLAALFAGLAVLKRLDRAWILVRRAAGVDQRGGILGRVFGTTAIVGAIGFTAWLLLIGGLGPTLAPR